LNHPNPHNETGWQDQLAQLSDRELSVFRAIGHGNTTRDIAQDLGISAKTVDTYRRRIKAKLGIDHTARLTVCAVSWHIQQGHIQD
jgi:DNA-binding NarL/FixJ family response regulator